MKPQSRSCVVESDAYVHQFFEIEKPCFAMGGGER
jgi:hypothetical protein